MFLILGRALILKNGKLCSQAFEIASWSGARKLPMAPFVGLCRDIASGGDKQASPFVVAQPKAESTTVVWTCYRNFTKTVKNGWRESEEHKRNPNRLIRELERKSTI